MFLGLGQFIMVSTLDGSVDTLLVVILCPKYSTWDLKKVHLDLLANNWFCQSMLNVCFRCSTWSDSILVYTTISSKKTNIKFPRNGPNSEFIRAWKVGGAFNSLIHLAICLKLASLIQLLAWKVFQEWSKDLATCLKLVSLIQLSDNGCTCKVFVILVYLLD